MATFSIKTVFDNPSWATGSSNFGNIPLSNLTYTRYDDQTLIYCNHPESITETYLGDNGYCINKATITTSEALLYISCNSMCNAEKKLVVRVYNPNTSPVTITKAHSGFNCTTNWSAQIGAYEEFFQGISEVHHINGGTSQWIEEESVRANGRFEGLMKYLISGGSLEMAVYLCTNKDSVGNNPSFPPVSNKEYSGTANAFYILGNHSLNASNLLNSYYNSAFFGITKKNFSGNSTENNPITLLQGGIASEDASTYNNIGNYGLQYAFNTTLRNNKPQGNVKFKGYIISNPKSHCAGISSGGLAKAFFLGPQGEGSGKNYVRWNFCETDYIGPGAEITLSYQYMHLGRGNAPGIIQWEVVE